MASHDSSSTVLSLSSPVQQGRLLVVDDEASVRDALCTILRERGYETRGCMSGAAALEVLGQEEFDVMLCDLMMGGMDGIALLRAVQGCDPDLVSILMTGQSSIDSAIEALRVGAFDYVLKPLKMSVLLPVLTRAMEMRRLRTENVHLREAMGMYELSMTVAFSLDAETIVRKMAETVLHSCRADEVGVVLPTAEGEDWRVVMAVGKDREQLVGQATPLEQTVLGWVVRHREPLLLHGAMQLGRYTPVRPRPEISTALAVPLLAGGRVVGVVTANRTQQQRAFTLGDQKAVGILASIAASALTNRQLYHELDLRVQERTAMLTETNRKLQGEIVERQRVEETLRRTEEYFRSLTENASDLIAVAEVGGVLRYVSPSVTQALGYQPEQLVGANGSMLIHPEDLPRVREVGGRLLSTPGASVRLECRAQSADGSFRTLEVVGCNLLHTPPVAGIVLNARDITERKEVERLKEDMVAVVSHELRTPLTSLRGFAELLLNRTFPPEKQREFLTIIHSEAVRLTNLINDFLDIQRLQAGRYVYQFAAVDLRTLLRDAVAVFTSGERTHPVRLEAPDSLPLVYADASSLRQVLTNLLSNAVKFSPHGGKVTVGARPDSTDVRVWVADRGLGIPQEALPKLFDKFYRVENHETRNIGGTGLGLAIVKEIIDAHKGALWVESESGKGSTFFFTLPVCPCALTAC